MLTCLSLRQYNLTDWPLVAKELLTLILKGEKHFKLRSQTPRHRLQPPTRRLAEHFLTFTPALGSTYDSLCCAHCSMLRAKLLRSIERSNSGVLDPQDDALITTKTYARRQIFSHVFPTFRSLSRTPRDPAFDHRLR